MKRSKGIQCRLICGLLIVLLILGLSLPSAYAEQPESESNKAIVSLADEKAIQPLADETCIAGNSYTLSGTIYTYDGTSKLTFSSSDSSIAFINSQNISSTVIGSRGTFYYSIKFAALKSGEVTIQAISDNGSVKMTKKITIQAPEATSVSLSKSSYVLNVGETIKANATVTPSLADQQVSWDIQDKEIATVDENGNILGIKFGNTKVTATTINGLSKSAIVNVFDPVESLTLNQNQLDLTKGDTETLTVSILPDTANQDVSWTTSDSKVASVSDGKVSAVSPGIATITVTSSDGKKTANCQVSVSYADAQSVKLDQSSVSIIKGESKTISATVTPDTADQAVTWESSDPKLVTVLDGKITGISAGTTTVTAKTSNGKIDACTVTVVLPEATSVSLNKSELTLIKGNTDILTAIVEPSDASQDVTWTSSDPKIATVSDGKVIGIAAGKATITAKNSNGKMATCTITVILPEVTSISLDQIALNLEKGKNATLTASVNPSDASQNVTWTSSNTDVATVTDGKITAVSAGTATITAKTANGKTATCTVTVPAPPATSVSLNLTSITLEAGKTKTLSAKVNPSDASQNVSWSSSDTKVATVSNGTIKGKSTGTATITVKTENGKTATCKVTVTNASSDTKPIYRLYMPSTGEHLYTSDKNEYDTLYQKYGWGQEGIGWYAPSSGTAVYRLYQPGLKNHLYTTDKNEVRVLTSKYGWVTDNGGEALYYSGGSVPIYRVYNKGLNGMHHLTTDTNEYNTLPKFGWKQEGATLYATKLGSPYATTKFYK